MRMPASETSRLRSFALFFRSYMNVAAIAAASIPIPVTAWKLIPIYTQQRGFLTVYSSLFCFLLLAFIFSIRHRLARFMFAGGWRSLLLSLVPLLAIVSTLLCILEYHNLLQESVLQLRALGLNRPTSELLAKVDSTEIPFGLPLAACYLGIFLSAETAFVMMALREYLQDVLHLDERELLGGVAAPHPEAHHHVAAR
jgi:hypothetical protein